MLLTEGQVGPITDQTAESYAATMFSGVILSMKHEVRVMQGQGSGSIINISSTYGHEGAAVYVGSKHAVKGITKSVALEIAKSGSSGAAATRDKVWPCREPSQPLGPTIAKMAPCGSRPWAIQLPPGTCMGPWMIWPPASFTRAIAASTASTLK
jgi:NAD(P)-dependent dehydrogenase (short-subunit alcohol dehydrogenase family)